MHGARIVWQSEGDFATGKYSRRHQWHFDGGAVVTASASPAVVRPPLSDPAGVDPEEAVAAALSSCHMLWFLDLARRAGFVLHSYEDNAEALMETRGGVVQITRITLRPKAVWATAPTIAEEDALHEAAHARCFIANSLKSEVVILPKRETI